MTTPSVSWTSIPDEQLHALADNFHIAGNASMNRQELIAAIEQRPNFADKARRMNTAQEDVKRKGRSGDVNPQSRSGGK